MEFVADKATKAPFDPPGSCGAKVAELCHEEGLIIRAIGDPEQRFQEDHLRLLRAVRFAARLGFEIEPATMAALQRLHGLIASVSAERIRQIEASAMKKMRSALNEYA